MIFGVIVIVLVAAVAYFHYVQGFFSAALSAMLAIISAVLAFSFHEVIIRALLQGKMADQAHAMVLVALFVIIYGVLRVIFDKAIPGNIRLPVLVDKIGAAVMGAVAGVFCVGIMVVAAQLLPFGPSIAGYARYSLNDKQEVRLPTQRQSLDAYVYDTLKSDSINPQDRSSLIIPVDDIVVGTARALSDGGSLAGPQSLTAVHPSYLDEAFLQRLGVQTGAKHVAYNLVRDKLIDVNGIYTVDRIPQADAEPTYIPNRWTTALVDTLNSSNEKIILIIRMTLSRNASDTDNNVRISPAAVRLVANSKNNLPIGTVQHEDGPIVRANRPDDFLIVKGDGVVDWVFLVDREDFGLGGDAKSKAAGLALGKDIFIEAKRMGYVDLSGKEVKREVPPSSGEGVLRKKELPAPKSAPGAAGTAAKELTGGPIEFNQLIVSDQFFKRINIGGHEGPDSDLTFRSGTGKLKENKIARLEIEPNDSIRLIEQGDFPMSDLYAGSGQKIVQIVAIPNSKNPWEWADKINQFELLDDQSKSYKPRGAWVKIKEGASDRMIARWDYEKQLNDLPHKGEQRPTDLWIAFVVPENTTIKEVRFAGKRIKSVDQRVS